MRTRLRAMTLAALLATTGCMVGPGYKMPELQMESHWTAAESPAVIEGAPAEPITWWEHFEDPVLTGLVKEALAQNLDLEAAETRLAAAFMSLEYRLSQCDKLIEAQGARSLGMVRLYAALGGGWEVQQGTPLVTDEAKEAMRDRTDWWSFGAKGRLEQTR